MSAKPIVGTPPQQQPKKRRRFSESFTVDVEIDASDLEDAGYHHEDDCPAKTGVVAAITAPRDVVEVIGSLHRQAHPTQHPSPFMCREEPCRSLPLDLVSTRLGRPS